jgi:hypothetical protein
MMTPEDKKHLTRVVQCALLTFMLSLLGLRYIAWKDSHDINYEYTPHVHSTPATR